MKQLLFLAYLTFSTILYGQSLQEIFDRGNDAFENGDIDTFYECMKAIDDRRPNYGPVVYKLAQAYVLKDQTHHGIATLRRLLLMDASYQPETDSLFHGIQDEQEFRALLDLRNGLLKDEMNASMHERIPLQRHHPESITFSPATKSFLLGMVRSGEIYQNGQLPAFGVDLGGSVMGMDVTSDHRYLWTCISRMDQYAPTGQLRNARGSILQIDLRGNEIINALQVPEDAMLGDLIVSSGGHVYSTDSKGNRIFRVTANDVDLWVDGSDNFINLQGLALNEDESSLYVADYIKGLFRIDIAAKTVHRISSTCDCTQKGIDGLYFYNGTLIALHNGTNPKRVMQYQLDRDTIISANTFARGGETLNEPTQGVIVRDAFYFIANSPWAYYNESGILDPPSDTTKLFRYPLD